MNTPHGLAYRPDIDALRAFAVIPVVLFHLGVAWIPGGFLGVDVFFVISGYLITGLLLRELKGGGVDLLGFWRRRILRILPALLVMVLVTVAAGHIFLYAPDRYMLALNAAGALLSFGNITHWRNYTGYWGADAADSPLLHTWSLGVEEQFYMLYPLSLLIAWRLMRDRTWLVLVVGLVVGAVLYAFALQRYPGAAFYLFPTRAWELLAGAVAAAYNMNRLPAPKAATVMSLAGLALVVTTYLFANEERQAIGALAAVSGASLVVAAGSPRLFKRLGLTVRPIILIGLISYSIYLWHWPLIIVGNAIGARSGSTVPPMIYLIGSLALGWLSWRFVECPVRRDPRPWLPWVLVAAAVGAAALAYALRNVNASEDTSQMHAARWDGERFNVNPVVGWPEAVRRRMRGIEVAPPLAGRQSAYLHGIDRRYGAHVGLDVLVLGDSHGLMWAPAIDAAAQKLGLNVTYMTADGTPVFFDPEAPEAAGDGIYFTREQWSAFNRAWLHIIRRDRPPIVVIASGWGKAMASTAAPLLDEITSAGSNVLLIEDAPDFAVGERNAPSYMAFLGIKPDVRGYAYSSLRDPVRTAEERAAVGSLVSLCAPRCTLVETRDLYEDQQSNVLVMASRTPNFIDDDHLSTSGALLAQPRLEKAFSTAIATRSAGG